MRPVSAGGGVSVVVPTRDAAPLLAETLASVFAQTLQPIEVLVVDDGSTDGTRALLDPLEAAGRLRVIRQAPSGAAAARNTGLRHASGAFIALLDHDDLWPADKLAWQVELLRSRPEVVLAYGFMESFGQERSYAWPPADVAPEGDVRQAFLRKNWIRSPGQTLIRASALEAAGGFDETIVGADDWDLYLRLAAIGPFAYAHRKALAYRTHGGNQSRRAWTMFRHACRVHARHAGRWPAGAAGGAGRWLKCRGTLVHMLARDLLAATRARAITSVTPSDPSAA
ncbi:MAG: glycosyltransferase family A protein [Vicinamibacterales bacterium]